MPSSCAGEPFFRLLGAPLRCRDVSTIATEPVSALPALPGCKGEPFPALSVHLCGVVMSLPLPQNLYWRCRHCPVAKVNRFSALGTPLRCRDISTIATEPVLALPALPGCKGEPFFRLLGTPLRCRSAASIATAAVAAFPMTSSCKGEPFFRLFGAPLQRRAALTIATGPVAAFPALPGYKGEPGTPLRCRDISTIATEPVLALPALPGCKGEPFFRVIGTPLRWCVAISIDFVRTYPD